MDLVESRETMSKRRTIMNSISKAVFRLWFKNRIVYIPHYPSYFDVDDHLREPIVFRSTKELYSYFNLEPKTYQTLHISNHEIIELWPLNNKLSKKMMINISGQKWSRWVVINDGWVKGYICSIDKHSTVEERLFEYSLFKPKEKYSKLLSLNTYKKES